MFCNECDLEGPGPWTAAQVYPEAEALGVKLLLSVGSHLDEGMSWARTFRYAYSHMFERYPQIDALGVHCYYHPESVGWCQGRVQEAIDLANEWGVGEVWVTEWACLPGTAFSLEECFQANRTFTGWMEGESMITRYFIFGSKINPQDPWNGGSMYNTLFWWSDPHNMTVWGEEYRTLGNQ
jgi:hypothetical protein